MEENFVIGLDYGSDSVRGILVNANNGEQLSESVFAYPRWEKGLYCVPDKNQYRQHPLDYIEGLEYIIKNLISSVGSNIAKNIRAIALDTTGSTPCPIDEYGTPLALLPKYKENPDAMFILWKDHTAIKEAGEINDFAHNKSNIDYTKFVGGIYSSEWFWAKILHILRTNEDIRKDAYSWVEHTDWIPALLTGNTHPEKLKRFRCAAGHKGMWNEEFNGLPPNDFFKSIDPLLDGISDRIGSDTVTAEKPVGKISEEWASKLGLSPNVIIGGAAFDCHFGAVGGGISAYDMVKVIGTSTCDIVVAPKDEFGDKLISGICGQVDGSVIPDMIGLEAGQSAFGDAYAWFKNIILDPAVKLINNSSILSESVKNNLIKEFSNSLIPLLTSEAQKLPVESSIIALDWINGRRTPDANQELTAGFMGLNISTTAYQMFKAVIDATAFGARSIQDRFTDHGVEIKRIIAIGGVSRKSPLVMQTLSDVLNREIIVCASDQACALGSCMFAAVAAGIYPSVEDASSAMSSGYDITYKPIPENVEIYKELYAKYKTFGTFIESQTGGN